MAKANPYTRRHDEVNAVKWDHTQESYDAMVALGATVELVENFSAEGYDRALQLLAGQEGVLGMTPVPDGHYVVKTDKPMVYFYTASEEYMRDTFAAAELPK